MLMFLNSQVQFPFSFVKHARLAFQIASAARARTISLGRITEAQRSDIHSVDSNICTLAPRNRLFLPVANAILSLNSGEDAVAGGDARSGALTTFLRKVLSESPATADRSLDKPADRHKALRVVRCNGMRERSTRVHQYLPRANKTTNKCSIPY